MTKTYLKPLTVHAWPDKHADGRAGYAFTDDSGELKWLPADEFEPAHIEIGLLTDLPADQLRIEVASAFLKIEAETLAEIKQGDKYLHMEEDAQKQLNIDLNNLYACIATLANRIAIIANEQEALAMLNRKR